MRLAIPNVPAINARFWPRGSNVKVDEQALLRHLGALDPAIFTFERRRRAEALRCLRKRDINHPGLPDAFLISFLMLLENDRRNFGLLREANLLPVVKQYLRAHLTPTDQDGGWPPLSETISLAVGLLWLMSSPSSIASETLGERHEVMEWLAPYVFAGFRYPLSFTSAHDGEGKPPQVADVHYPSPEQPSRHFTYFGRLFNFHCPPPIIYATASYFCRQELDQRTVPDRIPLERPKPTRTGLPVPIRADFEFFIRRCLTRFVNPCHEGCAEITESGSHDSDWTRILQPVEPVPDVLNWVGPYPRGLLGGDWSGSYIVPHYQQYQQWASSTTRPSPFEKFGRHPLYFTLEEYCCMTSTPASSYSFWQSWWEMDYRVERREGGSVDILNKSGDVIAHYEPHLPNSPESDRGVAHVLLLGETTTSYGEAWGALRFIGTVWPSDGKITILSENNNPANPDPARSIFEGYLMSSRNFCGKRRSVSGFSGIVNDPVTPVWESPFSLCKTDSDVPPCKKVNTSKWARVMARARRSLSAA